jgi:putative superfamily III holin-X
MVSYPSASPVRIGVRLAEEADELVRLQIALAREEALEVAKRNRGSVLLLAVGMALVGVALLVAVPVLLMALLPWHWEVAAGWLVVFLVAGAIAIPLGRSGLRLGMPRTVAVAEETEQWLLRQIRSFDA